MYSFFYVFKLSKSKKLEIMKLSKFIIGIVLSVGMLSATAQNVTNINNMVQVYDVASVNELEKNKYEQYIYETESFRIQYMFWSHQGKMQVKVLNKTKSPIYIDWGKSTYFFEKTSLPMAPDFSKLSEKDLELYKKYKAKDPLLTDMDYEWNKRILTAGSTEKQINIIEILPGSEFTKGNYVIVSPDGIILDTTKALEVKDKFEIEKKKNVVVYKQSFTSADSPIKFGCSLYLYSNIEGTEGESVITEYFYINNVTEIDAKTFRGKRIGRDAEGYANYKFPMRKSNRFFVEIDRRNSIIFKIKERR